MVEGDLRQSLDLLMNNVNQIRSSPENSKIRIDLCAASYMYNRASDSGLIGGATGVVTALAHSLDARYPECDHGSAYSILTAPGMKFNIDYNYSGQARLGRILGVADAQAEEKTIATAAATEINDIFTMMEMPTRLREVGVPRDGIRMIAEGAMTDFALHRNIRPVESSNDLEDLMQVIW